jgi:superoxide reductase
MTITSTQTLSIYKCAECGNIVELLLNGGGKLICCGQPMTLLADNTVDASREKHIPVIERTAEGILVTVGSIPHPMEAAHFIGWIELIADGKAYRQFLNPGDAPQALFPVIAEHVTAREFCNLHGVWKGED